MKNLKDAIKKLFSLNGEKKLFFAYAAGARKDGKGDGELVVGKSRPTKADVEGKLKAGTGFIEGFCWTGKSADDQDTVYFQGSGKPVSGDNIRQMKETAWTVASQRYKFKLASKEEEARAAKLPAADAAAPGEAASRMATSADPAAGPADEQARFEQELAVLQPRLDACLKQQLGDVNKMRALLNFAQGKAEAGQLPAAFQSLRMLQSLIQGAQAAAPPPAPPDAPAAEALPFKQRLQALTPRYQKAIQAGVANRARLEGLMRLAVAAAKAQDFGTGLRRLDELEVELDRPAAATAASPAAAALQAWQAARAVAVTQIRDLGKQFAASKHPDAKEALGLLSGTIKNLTENPATVRQVQELERYLTEDAVIADVCLAFDLQTPLLTALAGLKA